MFDAGQVVVIGIVGMIGLGAVLVTCWVVCCNKERIHSTRSTRFLRSTHEDLKRWGFQSSEVAGQV